jgi:hypothetical protein
VQGDERGVVRLCFLKHFYLAPNFRITLLVSCSRFEIKADMAIVSAINDASFESDPYGGQALLSIQNEEELLLRTGSRKAKTFDISEECYVFSISLPIKETSDWEALIDAVHEVDNFPKAPDKLALEWRQPNATIFNIVHECEEVVFTGIDRLRLGHPLYLRFEDEKLLHMCLATITSFASTKVLSHMAVFG